MEKPEYPVRINDNNELLRSEVASNELNGPLVKAPSEPAPVVDGDLVKLLTNSIKSSGSSWKWTGLYTARGRMPGCAGLFLLPGKTAFTGKCTGLSFGISRQSRIPISAM